MWTYPSDHQPPVTNADPPQVSAEQYRSLAIINLAFALCGIAFAWGGELHGALIVLIVLQPSTR
jgi:hypothetical protein